MGDKLWRRLSRRIALEVARLVHPMVTSRVGPHLVRYSVRDLYMGRDLFMRRPWEPGLMRLLPGYDLAGGVAIDVGACFGIYSLALSELVGPAGQVIAIEPDPELFALLRQNVVANALQNVTLVQRYAGRKTADGFLLRNRTNVGNNRIVDAGTAGATAVSGVRIDELTEALPPGSVRFVKIDVEGYEAEVLAGMTRTLERNPDAIVQLELTAAKYGGDPGAVLDALRQLGLDGWEIWPRRVVPLQSAEWYEAPRFADIINVVVARDTERLEERIRTVLDVCRDEDG